MAAPEDRFVPLAVIRHAHGLRGEVKLVPLGGAGAMLFEQPLREASGAPFPLTRTGTHPTHFICRIEGVTDRSGAEALKGKTLGLMRSELGESEPESLYAADLVGTAVVNEAGRAIGRIARIVNYGASDIVVIERTGGAGELMVPYAAAFFPEDVQGGTLLCLVPESIEARGQEA